MTMTVKLAACMSAALLLAVAACSSGPNSGTPIPPPAHKAVVLKTDSTLLHDTIVPPRPVDRDDRYAVEPVVLSPTVVYSNGVYGLNVVDPADSTHSSVLNLGPGSSSRELTGVVGLPGGGLAYSDDDQYQVLKCSPCTAGSTFHEEVIAGANAEAPRPTYDPTPDSAPADGITLTARAAAVGVLSDGSIVIVDGTAVWALKDSRLTRVYQRTLNNAMPNSNPWLDAMPVGRIGAIGPHDTIWLAPEKTADQARLGDVVGVTAGVVHSLELPESIKGIQTPPADLSVWAMVSDAGDGLYVEASSPTSADRYLIHVTGGTAVLLAESTVDEAAQANRTARTQGTFDPLHIPVVLPSGIAVLPNMLLLTGCANYAVSIPR